MAVRTPAQVLRDAREALGGDAKLRAVKALVVEGWMITNPGGREYRQPYGFKMLLPDRFQMTDNPFGHTLDGAEYWRIEKPYGVPDSYVSTEDIRREAQRSTESRFYNEALTFLLEPPPRFSVQMNSLPTSGVPNLGGEVVEWTRQGGRFPLAIVFDTLTHRPTALVGKALRTNPANADEFTVSRVTLLQDYRAVEGVQFPFRLDERLGEDLHVLTSIDKVVVNPSLGPADFKNPAK